MWYVLYTRIGDTDVVKMVIDSAKGNKCLHYSRINQVTSIPPHFTLQCAMPRNDAHASNNSFIKPKRVPKPGLLFFLSENPDSSHLLLVSKDPIQEQHQKEIVYQRTKFYLQNKRALHMICITKWHSSQAKIPQDKIVKKKKNLDKSKGTGRESSLPLRTSNSKGMTPQYR